MHPNGDPEAKTLDVLHQLLEVRELPYIHEQRTVADFPKIVDLKLSVGETTVLDLVGEGPEIVLVDFPGVTSPGRPDGVLDHPVVGNARGFTEVVVYGVLVGDLRVLKEPEVVFQDIFGSPCGVGVSDFSDQTEMVVQLVVVVDEERYFRGDVEVHAVRVEPVALAHRGIVFLLGYGGVLLQE